jgi:hypothetical protein
MEQALPEIANTAETSIRIPTAEKARFMHISTGSLSDSRLAFGGAQFDSLGHDFFYFVDVARKFLT